MSPMDFLSGSRPTRSPLIPKGKISFWRFRMERVSRLISETTCRIAER